MGQYYVIATREPKSKTIQCIAPNGIKMMEHAWLDCSTTRDVFTQLLHRPMQVAWVGDYACRAGEYNDVTHEWEAYPQPVLAPNRPALYAGREGKARAKFVLAAYKSWWAASETVQARHQIKFEYEDDNFNPADFVIVNDSKKLYIDCKHQIALYTQTEKYGNTEYKSCVNPLAILCDASQEDAGGDYHGANMWASGIWCGDIIRVEKREDFLAINNGLADDYRTREQGYEEFSVPFTDTMRVMTDTCLDNLNK